MFNPLIDRYKVLFNVKTDLDALMHLILAGPVLDKLMYLGRKEEHYTLDENELRQLITNFQLFEKYLMFGYYVKHFTEIKGRHSWIHLPEPVRGGAGRAQVGMPIGSLRLPYGFLDHYSLSKWYPKIAAINLLVDSYGDPLLNSFRAFLEENKQKSLDDIDKQIFEIINAFTPETGGELREYAPITKEELRNSYSSGLQFLDEPKLYEVSKDHFEVYMTSLRGLNHSYFRKPLNHFEELNNTFDDIKHLRNESNYFEALKTYESELVGFPYFPVFAFNRFNETDIKELVFIKGEEKAEDLNKRVKESIFSEAESWEVRSDLKIKLEDYKTRGFNPLRIRGTMLPDFLVRIKKSTKTNLLSYSYQTIFEESLDFYTTLYLLDQYASDKKETTRIELKDKKLKDLANITIILKAVGFFKSEKQAAEFVAKSFEVRADNDYLQAYRPATIINELNRLKNSNNKQFLKDQIKKINEAIETEE